MHKKLQNKQSHRIDVQKYITIKPDTTPQGIFMSYLNFLFLKLSRPSNIFNKELKALHS